jgi:hypothetical protein
MTHPTRIEQVAATIRTRHLNAQEARALDHNLSAAEIPDPHPRPGEPGAWAWRGEVQECATRPPGRRSRALAG